jgi:hypothetical protein
MGTFSSKKVVGFESCAVLPVVEALYFAPLLMFVKKIRWPSIWYLLQWWGVTVVAREHSHKEFTGEQRRITETITRV